MRDALARKTHSLIKKASEFELWIRGTGPTEPHCGTPGFANAMCHALICRTVLDSVRPMDDVAANLDGIIATDGARCALVRLGGACGEFEEKARTPSIKHIHTKNPAVTSISANMKHTTCVL